MRLGARFLSPLRRLLPGALLAIAGFAVVPVRASAQEPGLRASLSSINVYLGDSVTYQVEVLNVEQPTAPVVSAPDGLDVEMLEGRRQITEMNLNGRRTRIETFVYRLTPRRGGDIEIPGPKLTVDGRVLEGNAVTLHVIEPRDQDLVILHTRVDRDGRYPLQPFTVRLRIFVHRLPGNHAGRSPVSVLDPPALLIPWVEQHPDGLVPESDWTEWLTRYIWRGDRREFDGFTINGLKTRGRTSLFGVIEEPRLIEFELPGRPATAADVEDVQRLRGRHGEYFVYELPRTFEPRRPGAFFFADTSIRGDFVSGIENGGAVVEHVFDLGGATTVNVEEAPASGRPAAFEGAYGRRFDLRVDLRPRRARVGDPMTLTVSVDGDGNLEQLAPLDLAGRPEFGAFKIQDPTLADDDGVPVFTYSVRATTADIREFPPVELAWFDPFREEYRTIHSDPIEVRIDAIESLGRDDIVTGGDAGGRRLARKDGLFGNKTDVSLVRDERVDLRAHAIAWASMLLFYLGVAATARVVGRVREDPARRRRRKAAARARARCEEARKAIERGDREAAAAGLKSALAGLVADAALVPEAGMTPRDAERLLSELGVSEPVRDAVYRALEACDALRFGGASDALAEDSMAAIDAAIAELKRLGRLK